MKQLWSVNRFTFHDINTILAKAKCVYQIRENQFFCYDNMVMDQSIISVFSFQSSSQLCTSERKRLFFGRFLKTVFDEAELRHSEHEFSCCRKHPNSHDSSCRIASTSLESKLQAVLSRLVTDYRAIFAIEGACEKYVSLYFLHICRRHGY